MNVSSSFSLQLDKKISSEYNLVNNRYIKNYMTMITLINTRNNCHYNFKMNFNKEILFIQAILQFSLYSQWTIPQGIATDLIKLTNQRAPLSPGFSATDWPIKAALSPYGHIKVLTQDQEPVALTNFPSQFKLNIKIYFILNQILIKGSLQHFAHDTTA